MNGNTVLESTEQDIQISEAGTYTLVTTLANCSTTSDPVVIEVLSASDPECVNGIVENEMKVKVFPNPFHETLVVEMDQTDWNNAIISIFDSMGKEVYQKEADSERTYISLPQSGLYLLRITSGKSSKIFKLTGK